MTTSVMPLDSVMDWDEGRRSESCRRVSFLMLFDEQGRPHRWFWILGTVVALVVAAAVGL